MLFRTIFVDLDGVLVNFESKVSQLGWNPEQLGDKSYYEKFKNYIDEATDNGLRFWSDMKPMPDAGVLWSHLKKFNPVILSSIGGSPNAIPQKTEWIHKYIPGTKHIFVEISKDKAIYACPNCLLIDDREKSIVPWEEAGGIGILHTSAQATIEKLENLLNDN